LPTVERLAGDGGALAIYPRLTLASKTVWDYSPELPRYFPGGTEAHGLLGCDLDETDGGREVAPGGFA
jgi:hypothetical protein